jgi:hypothetical protein
MMDRLEDLPPQEPYLRLARQGCEVWNRWKAGELDADERDALLQQLDLSDLPVPDEPVDFSGTDFRDEANRDIKFCGFRFGDHANFSDSTFGDLDIAPVWEQDAHEEALDGFRKEQGSPKGGALFLDSIFGYRARFDGATFGYRARFDGATFGYVARFDGATGEQLQSTLQDVASGMFGNLAPGYASVVRQKWIQERLARARPASFSSISFVRARFHGNSSFTGRTFTAPANFQDARFDQPPEFAGTEGHGFLDLTGMDVRAHGTLRLPLWNVVREWNWREIVYIPTAWRLDAPTNGWTISTESATRVRRLRQLASSIHAHDTERDLFILSRQIERGYLWRYKPWQAVMPTLMVFAYSLLSNFGRSLVLPLFWLGIATVSAHVALVRLYVGFQGSPEWQNLNLDQSYPATWFNSDLTTFTLGNSIPFLGLFSTTRRTVVQSLFGPEMAVPWEIYLASTCQSIISIVLIFLFLLAVRTHLRLKA